MAALNGRIVLVTGGVRGIGQAIVRELVAENARVSIQYNTGDIEAQAISDDLHSRGGDIHSVQSAITLPDQSQTLIGQVADYWGTIDSLVINPGFDHDDTGNTDWSTIIDRGLNCVYYLLDAILPVMTDHRYGRIVIIGPPRSVTGDPGSSHYAVVLGGLEALVNTLAPELSHYNITINLLSAGGDNPGRLTRTELPSLQQLLTKLPSGYFATPDEIARTVRFLVAEGEHITGQQLTINGVNAS